MSEPAAIEARGLSFRYPSGTLGLAPADFDIAAGESVALIGPNGSGKSTLLRLLATDLRPSAGALRLFGIEAHPAPPTLRRTIGYAPDRPVLFEPLTGAENLRYFGALSGRSDAGGEAGGQAGEATDAEARSERADAGRGTLGTLGPPDALDQPVSGYSFGMRRRLLLRIALAGDPRLVLLDEPSVGLDPSGVAILGGLLGQRIAAGGIVVFATNEVREVPKWASRVLFLHCGDVVADETPEALLRTVRGRTELTLVVSGPPVELPEFEGVERSDRATDTRQGEGAAHSGGPTRVRTLRLASRRGSGVLPELLAGVLDAGLEIHEVRVREPDLRDVFRRLTGASLGDEGGGRR